MILPCFGIIGNLFYFLNPEKPKKSCVHTHTHTQNTKRGGTLGFVMLGVTAFLLFGSPLLTPPPPSFPNSIHLFAGLAYQGKDILVFRFIIEYNKLKGFWSLGNNNRSI